ncbi:glycosyltransferase family 2 protein [Novosphingobium mangrovi (ex Huang et al. 2023)]|uniref:Glycosyltransferase n=1 Tax=Novosphingobium mangrovi (ex Huang et al. 2023) TaxID=2976432 RepID=A0ABT2I9K3_9SPHN|nr:glycosyltransferase [Novosphingobium mangrovi (ex Huang et al. 2023)]MCT2401500.1 glycosyltransferase [Novosphingobium mangrovi (ex Huang et al. 2023)]
MSETNVTPPSPPTSAASAPQISVVVVTYNHARYIVRAIESVLAQETGRLLEIIVSEDASTDGTRRIVEDLAARDPRIRLLLSERNLRSNEVVARAIRAARGEYLCILDGDDFWIARDKLERQAAELDGDPAASACFHNAAIVHDDDEQAGDECWTPPTQPKRLGKADIWRGNPFATCAGMLRRSALQDLGPWYADFFPITDWPLYVLCAMHGDLKFVDEVVGAYRLHDGGLFSSRPGADKLRMTSRFYSRMKSVVDARNRKLAARGGAHYFLEWAQEYAHAGQRRLQRLCLWYAARAGVLHKGFPWRLWLKAAMA